MMKKRDERGIAGIASFHCHQREETHTFEWLFERNVGGRLIT